MSPHSKGTLDTAAASLLNQIAQIQEQHDNVISIILRLNVLIITSQRAFQFGATEKRK